jgi:hypothetical protein
MASCAGRDALGSIAFGAGRIANLEWPYLNLLQQVRQSGWYASILETDEGRAVGCASVTPLRLGDGYRPWPGVWCVDLLIHDAFTDKATDLLGSLALPSGKCLAFVSPSAADKIAALGARGFVREGVLTGMLPAGDVDRDVAIYGLGT